MNPFYRVDNRLVHGQIIATWIPHLRLKRVIVASDTVPENPLQISVFGMSVPSGVSFEAMSVANAARWLGSKAYGKDSTIVLLETVEDAARLFGSGHPFPWLNIGNVHHGPASRRFTNAVYLSNSQLDQLRTLMRRGVKVEIRSLPDEPAIDLKRALGEA